VAAFVAMLFIQSLLFAPHAETLPYRDFKALVRATRVTDVAVAQQVISGNPTPAGLEGLLPKETIQELQRAGKGPHPFVPVQ
jgi:cell division protease FtsH